MKYYRIFFNASVLVLWMWLIFFLSDREGLALSTTFQWEFYLERKGAHVIEYLILTVLGFRFFRHLVGDPIWAVHLGALLAFSYAASDEMHQLLVPGREGRITDVFIDSIGIFLALTLIRLLHRTKRPCA
jgi:hypothetical protein